MQTINIVFLQLQLHPTSTILSRNFSSLDSLSDESVEPLLLVLVPMLNKEKPIDYFALKVIKNSIIAL